MTHEERAREFFGCEEEHATRCCEWGGEDGSGCIPLAALLASVAAEERERIRGAINDRAGMVWFDAHSEKEAGRRFGLDEALGAIDPKEPQAPKSAAIRKGE